MLIGDWSIGDDCTKETYIFLLSFIPISLDIGTDGDNASSSIGLDERVLTTLLSEMDGVESGGGSSSRNAPQVFILGCSTRPDRIDSAIMRPGECWLFCNDGGIVGRLDRLFFVNYPTTSDRASIISLYLSQQKISNIETRHIDQMATSTSNWTGSDLEEMIRYREGAWWMLIPCCVM